MTELVQITRLEGMFGNYFQIWRIRKLNMKKEKNELIALIFPLAQLRQVLKLLNSFWVTFEKKNYIMDFLAFRGGLWQIQFESLYSQRHHTLYALCLCLNLDCVTLNRLMIAYLTSALLSPIPLVRSMIVVVTFPSFITFVDISNSQLTFACV